MRCETCLEAYINDDVIPPCFNDSPSWDKRGPGGVTPDIEPGVNACWIPDPDEAGQRALEIRTHLVRLADYGVGDAVLKMHKATMEDLELIAVIEDELRQIREEKLDG